MTSTMDRRLLAKVGLGALVAALPMGTRPVAAIPAAPADDDVATHIARLTAAVAGLIKREIGDALRDGIVTDRMGERRRRGKTPAGLIRGVCAAECEDLTARYRAVAPADESRDYTEAKIARIEAMIGGMEAHAVRAVEANPIDPCAAALAAIDDVMRQFNECVGSARSPAA